MYMRKDNWFLSRLRGFWKEYRNLVKAAYVIAVVLAVFGLTQYNAAVSDPVMKHVKAETLERLTFEGEGTETQASVQTDKNIAMFSILGAYPFGQAGFLNQNQTMDMKEELALLSLEPDSAGEVIVEEETAPETVEDTALDDANDVVPDDVQDLHAPDVKRRAFEAADEAAAVSRTVISITQEEVEILQRIVEAEATGQDIKGKILVANVVLNRVMSDDFPNTIKEVVFQRTGDCYQFSPIRDKRYWSVEITEETVEAVERALAGEDYSEGALFFAARKYADQDNMDWFDNNLTYLFQYGGHEFFK